MPLIVTGLTLLGASGAAVYVYYNNDNNLLSNLTQKKPEEKKEDAPPIIISPIESASKKEVKETKIEKEEPQPKTASATKEPMVDTTSLDSKTTSGNRVLQVHIPDNMKNTKTDTKSDKPTDHPKGGNRVYVEVPSSSSREESDDGDSKKKKKKKKKKEEDSVSATELALDHLQSSANSEAARSLVQSHHSLWASLDASYFADMDRLNTSQLKARIVQLATELKDRTQWEAVRLKEFLALKEKETAQQYMEVLQKQRLEFEDILATRLREQDSAFHQQLKEALDKNDAAIQSVVNAALAAQQEEHDQDKEAFAAKFKAETELTLNKHYGEQMETYKKAVEQNLQEKVATLAQLSEKLKKLETALEVAMKSQQGSSKVHKLSAAALALSEVLETHKPAAQQVQALEKAAGSEGLIAAAVKTLPASVQTEGVPTVPELQTTFEDHYYRTCRQAAFVPSGRPGLDGQLAGIIFASLKYPPQPDDDLPPPHHDHATNPSEFADYVLAKARKLVQLGNLTEAVQELDRLDGTQVGLVVRDWKTAALERLAVDKAIKVIKLECALLHENSSSSAAE